MPCRCPGACPGSGRGSPRRPSAAARSSSSRDRTRRARPRRGRSCRCTPPGRWVGRVAALVADGRRPDAGLLPERLLLAPEAAERELGDLEPSGYGPAIGVPRIGVRARLRIGWDDRAGHRRGRASCGLAEEEHAERSSGCAGSSPILAGGPAMTCPDCRHRAQAPHAPPMVEAEAAGVGADTCSSRCAAVSSNPALTHVSSSTFVAPPGRGRSSRARPTSDPNRRAGGRQTSRFPALSDRFADRPPPGRLTSRRRR